MRTPMPAVAVLPVIPLPSPRGDRMSPREFRDRDQQLEDQAPSCQPKVRLEDPYEEPDAAAVSISQLQVEARQEEARAQCAR